MSQSKQSLMRRLLARLPLPLLAVLLGLGSAMVTWVFVDRVQTRMIADVFEQEREQALKQRTSEGLLRFENFLQSYVAVTQLLANHRRLANYLEPIIWFSDDGTPLRVHTEPPVWLPSSTAWNLSVRPSHVLLVDNNGMVQEDYQLRETPLPVEWLRENHLPANIGNGRAYLTRVGSTIYLLVAEQVEDTSHNRMGSLVLLVPIDTNFLAASQQRVSTTDTVVAIIDSEHQQVLSSSDPPQVPLGHSIEQLQQQFLITAQSFFEYGEADSNLLFATLLPRASFEATGQRLLDAERRQRLIGTLAVAAVFVLLFVVVSARINKLLHRLSQFSRRALDMKHPSPVAHGNQLLIMEEWMREFIETVRKAREEMQLRYEAEVQESEALKAAIMATSLDAIVTIDRQGLVIDFNPTAEQTFGYWPEEVLNRRLASLVLAPDCRAAFQGQLNDCLATSESMSEPARRVLTGMRRDRSTFPMEVAIKSIHVEGEQPLFTVYFHDISQQRRQAQEIESLAAFPSESPIPMLRINRPGVVLYANNASDPLLAYWGCQRSQTLPIYWRRQVQEVLEEGTPRELEINSEAGIFSVLLAPVRNQEYVNIYARDITEMRWAEEEVERRQNELIHVARLTTMGEMATGIAHELNQPLSAIINFANGCVRRIRYGSGDAEALLSALKQISNQADRAGEIIKRLRGMVTRQAPVRQEVGLNELINESCSLIAFERKRRGITIQRHLSAEPLPVRVDPVQIEQVLLNLMRNAFDAMVGREKKGVLTISSGAWDPHQVFVTVQDNGSGIDAAAMDHLFTPFFSTKSSGMGIGLSISQNIVSEHDGSIKVESKPGEGSRFTILLPRSIAAVEERAVI